VTELRPFRALRYDPRRVDLSRVIVPPYDVIAPEERAALWERDPHSAVRLELTRRVEEEAATDYAEVARTLSAWRREGVLRRDDSPALYALRQRYRAPDGSPVARDGFFALLRLEDYAKRVVLPHEATLAAPKADRLKQLRAARTNLSPVFLLYEDRERALAPVLDRALAEPPLASARDDAGAEHALARLADPEGERALRDFLADRPVVIADGHHRYETALAYRDERRAASPNAGPDAPHEWLLAYFANAYAEGTLLLPIHRVIRKGSAPTDAAWRARLPGWEERRVPLPDPDVVPHLLAEHLAPLRDRHAFAADDASGWLRIFSRPRPAPEALDVRALHREVVEGVFGLTEDAVREGAVAYPKDARRAAQEVRSGGGAVALFLNPLAPDDVFRVTRAGELLPQKSTFFHPKLPSGLVFRPLGDGEGA